MDDAPNEMHDAVEHGFVEQFVQRYPIAILETLLTDRTTGCNILWADSEYERLGDGYASDDEITVEKVTGLRSGVIKPRVAKELERQSQRTKARAEVFTPSWLCNRMNNHLDSEWFGRDGAFNVESDRAWTATEDAVEFPKAKGRGWQSYVRSRRLEITCGEAPFICSRYNAATGAPIPVRERIGFLDRKLRVVGERCATRQTWLKWAYKALQATYGYEYQGDNLLIARINVFETFVEHHRERWGEGPALDELGRVAEIVSWNVWQMDGMTFTPPTEEDVSYQLALFESEPDDQAGQTSMFDFGVEIEEDKPEIAVPLCRAFDWDEGESVEFVSLRGRAHAMEKKFYAIIGNPPYQSDKDDNDRKPPIYDAFMDAAYEISDLVELITPGRFLFNAGQTPKAWNEKMLADEHLKVLDYQPDSSLVFPGTDIKGGIAITLRNAAVRFGAIETFTINPELNGIIKRVNQATMGQPRLDSIFASQRCYKFSDAFYQENASNKNVTSKLGPGNKIKIVSKVMEDLPELFTVKPSADDDYRFYGRIDGKRECRYIAQRYIRDNEYIRKWKLLIPEANNSGQYGETLATPIVVGPNVGSTDTFLNAGPFDAESETSNLALYYKTKFFRALLGVKKVTQHSPSQVWKTIPLQDFTFTSDIDWSRSVAEIDRQLYAKYGLSDEEIEFIETHVQEMS